MSVNTVIFDLDGTLLYTLEDLTDSTNYALNSLGYPSRTIDEVKSFVGNGVSLLIERALPEGVNEDVTRKCLEIFKEHYSENMFNKTKVYDDVIPMLSGLKKQGFKIAVVSNKFDSAVKTLCEKYFKGYIDYSVGQRENVSKKPSPDAIYEVIRKFGVEKENCIFVGDSEVDIETAANAGIPCISVVWGYKDIAFLYEHGASVFVYSPMELLDLI